MTTTNQKTYLVRSGYMTQHKHFGYGDGVTEQERFTSSLDEANALFEQLVRDDGKTEFRDPYYLIAEVEIFEANEDGEFIGQPIREFRSAIKQEVAS